MLYLFQPSEFVDLSEEVNSVSTCVRVNGAGHRCELWRGIVPVDQQSQSKGEDTEDTHHTSINFSGHRLEPTWSR